MIAAAKQKVAIYSRRPAYDSRATRPKTGDKPLIHGGVRNHHHHYHHHHQSKELHPLFLINEHWKIFLFLLHLSLNLSLGIINPNHRILPQPYSSPLSKHNLQPPLNSFSSTITKPFKPNHQKLINTILVATAP